MSAALSLCSSGKAAAAWLLGHTVLSGSVGDDGLAEELAGNVLKWSQEDDGLSRSNRQGAWHSRYLETSFEPILKDFERSLRPCLDSYWAELSAHEGELAETQGGSSGSSNSAAYRVPLETKSRPQYRLHFNALWANLLQGSEQSNTAHRHAQSWPETLEDYENIPVVSGVYYAEVPAHSADRAALRLFTDNASTNVESVAATFVDVSPEVGKVVLFPATNLHEVVPTKSTRTHSQDDDSRATTRISLSFNIIMRPLTSALDEIVAAGNVSALHEHFSESETLGDDDATPAGGLTPLHHACELGHVGVVRSLLRYRADPLATTKAGTSALQLAINAGHTQVALILVRHSPSLLTLSHAKTRATPIHLAAAAGNLQLLHNLLSLQSAEGSESQGASYRLRARQIDGTEPLHSAVTNGHHEVAACLLQHGADPNAQDAAGLVPLHEALRGNLLQLAIVLHAAGASLSISDHDGRDCFYWAARGCHFLNGVIAVRAYTSLVSDFRGGHTRMLEWLQDQGATMSFPGPPPTAQEDGKGSKMADYLAASILLQGGGGPKAALPWATSPLLAAIEEGHVEAVRFIISTWPKLLPAFEKAPRAVQPVHSAVMSGQLEVVELLLSESPKASKRRLEVKCVGELRALHLAAAFGHKDIVRLLVAQGSLLNEKASDGSSALHFASASGHMEVVEELLDAGADVGLANRKGLTPLGLASRRSVALALIKGGADPRTAPPNMQGLTPDTFGSEL